MIYKSILAFLFSFSLLWPADGRTQLPTWPLRSPAESLLEQAASARQRGEFRLALSLVTEAEAEEDAPLGRLELERGLLARDRGQLDAAAEYLHASAEVDPDGPARLDHAGVLVQLGRWPEAVVVLRRAFDEQGYRLRVDEVVSDPRFVKLSGFEPYKALISRERVEQSGPMARLILTLERIDAASSLSAGLLERLGAVVTFLWRVALSVGTPIVLLLLLALLFAFGVSQTGLVRRPWTLIVGLLLASMVWHAAVRVATEGAAHGGVTIGYAAVVLFLPWLVTLGVQWFLRRRRAPSASGQEPFSREQLPHTLAIVEEVARVGRRWLEAEGESRAEAERELVLAQRALRSRLSGEGAADRLPAGATKESPTPNSES